MPGLSQAILAADVEVEKKIVDELHKLKEISEKLPYSIKTLLDGQEKIDGSMYHNGFFDTLGIVVPHETSLETQEELKGIKDLIEKILES